MNTKQIDTLTAIKFYLNKYCLDKIWNMPLTEYRQNFIARVINIVPQMGSVDLGPVSLYLPYTDTYYVYEISKSRMGNLNIKVPEWTPLDEWLDTNPFDFRVTGTNGEWLWRRGIYVIDCPCKCSLIMAIEAKMARAILGEHYDFKKIYVSVYVDSDGEPLTDLSTECIRPTSLVSRNHVWELAQNADMVFINGRESQLSSMEDIMIGDYVELVTDPDIMSDFTLDLSKVKDNHLYRSKRDARFNYIFHIPKKDNPLNYLITHNTCDLFVRPLNVPNSRLKGLFLHRFNTTGSIIQLTHNDFAVSEILLNSYMEALGTTEIAVRVVARRHAKGLRLVMDADYIKLLYLLNDNEILRFLVGRGDASLPFWRADHLESSKYAELMFNNPAFCGIDSMSGFIQALGYYNTISLICKRVTRTTIGPNTTHIFTVDIPLALLPVPFIDAHVFINGYFIDHKFYTVTKHGQYAAVSIDTSIPLPLNTEVVIELFERTKFYAEFMAPAKDKNALKVTGEIAVYRARENDEDKPLENWFADQYDVDFTFEEVPSSTLTNDYWHLTDNEDGTKTLSFEEDQFGRTFLICTKRLMIEAVNGDFHIGQLRGKSISTGMLMVDATQWSDGKVITIPVPHKIHPIVYLNQRELVQGVDYMHIVNKSYLGYVASQAVHINNSQYLKSDEANNLTIFLTTDPCFAEEHGFVVSGKIKSLSVLLFWYQELALLLHDGLAVRNLIWENGCLRLKDAREGALWYIRGMIPENINEIMLQYGTDEDTEKCMAILEFFKSRMRNTDEFVVIPHSHHIYSVLFNEIINDVLNGDFKLKYDADLARMRDQVAKYLTAADQDAALTGVADNIAVRGAGTLRVNEVYKPTDRTAKGSARRWFCEFTHMSIWFNTDKSRWEIVSTLKNATGVYYYANDTTGGLADPTNLDWETGDAGAELPPVLETTWLDLSYVDIVPSYRLYDSATPEVYRTLEHLKRALLPDDPNRDIRTDQP